MNHGANNIATLPTDEGTGATAAASKTSIGTTLPTSTTLKPVDKRLDSIREVLESQPEIIKKLLASFAIGMSELTTRVLASKNGYARLDDNETLFPKLINIKANLQTQKELEKEEKMKDLKKDWDNTIKEFKEKAKGIYLKHITENSNHLIEKRWKEFFETMLWIAQYLSVYQAHKIGYGKANTKVLGSTAVYCCFMGQAEADTSIFNYLMVEKDKITPQLKESIFVDKDDKDKNGIWGEHVLDYITYQIKNRKYLDKISLPKDGNNTIHDKNEPPPPGTVTIHEPIDEDTNTDEVPVLRIHGGGPNDEQAYITPQNRDRRRRRGHLQDSDDENDMEDLTRTEELLNQLRAQQGGQAVPQQQQQQNNNNNNTAATNTTATPPAAATAQAANQGGQQTEVQEEQKEEEVLEEEKQNDDDPPAGDPPVDGNIPVQPPQQDPPLNEGTAPLLRSLTQGDVYVMTYVGLTIRKWLRPVFIRFIKQTLSKQQKEK